MSLTEGRRALIVSPYFLPSNLIGVQRNRFLATHLHRFGWKPIVIAVDPRWYEEPVDYRLGLIPEDATVVYVDALPTRMSRFAGIGDLSLRGHFGLKKGVADVLSKGLADLVFVSILPGYSAMIGAWAKRRWGVPFVLDYQDPWASDWGAAQPKLSKAGISHTLADFIERRVVPAADAITAVSDGTLDTLRRRRLLREGLPVEIMPIGVEPKDFESAMLLGRSVIDRAGDRKELVYLGSIGDGMLESIKVLFAALKQGFGTMTSRVNLIGVSGQAGGKDHLNLAGLAHSMGVADHVNVIPGRIPFIDALRTMRDADALLLLGTRYTHYTASKIFPYWLARKPIVGLFHQSSTLSSILDELGGGRLVTYGDDGPQSQVPAFRQALADVLAMGLESLPARNDAAFERYSALAITGDYARLFERLISRPAEARR